MPADNDSLRTRLERGAAQLNVELSAKQLDLALAYLDLLGRWNRRFNLTAIRDPKRMVTEHVLDALSIAHAVEGQRVIDVGTGAGLPGLILAIIRPDRDTTLLDANGKKTRFLREAVRQLGLSNVTIYEGRSEDYAPDAAFDTVMCRAFAPLPRLVAVAAHLRAPHGILLAQKGQLPRDEIDALDGAWQVDSAPIHVPGLDKTRHVLTLRPVATS